MRRLLVTAFATLLVSCGTTGTGLEGATTLSIGRRPILLGPVTGEGVERAVVDDLLVATEAGSSPARAAAPATAGEAPPPAVPPLPVSAPPAREGGPATSTEGTWLASVFSLLAAPPPPPPPPPPRPVAAGAGAAPAPARAWSAPPASLDDILACIRAHESNGNYQATNGIYRGAYQFDYSTWQSVGGSGDPVNASAAEQDHRAALLYQARGGQPWPNARC